MLYEKYSPKMLSLCAYYIKDLQKSEEVMLSGFLKVFTKLHQYSQKGSFEGWVRKIMVYECISYLRKKNTLLFTDEIEFYESVVENEIELKIAIEDLQIFINKLPEGCKIIFNMYVIEGYKHTEIADMLNISVGTCKTQLHRARKALQDMISHHQKKKIL
ncbi:RNA polymerase sigma factor [Lutimonas saemankumensis]|uniref:RNA polymerase sigma factor n=1 Tax=Lutimonas saemankumensis TaxID=483016 RepID=UPI0021D411B8|nr:RNA polymerase sigma factor [Lutimonas saemankumensis]